MTISNAVHDASSSPTGSVGTVKKEKKPVLRAVPKEDPIVCTKCGADRVARSRAQSLDGLVMRFLPRRPYRCMRCYHRFWHSENFFADKRRVKTWIGMLVLALLFVTFQLLFNSQRSAGDPEVQGIASFVDRIDNRSDPPRALANIQISEDSRAIIQAMDFQPPREADVEVAMLTESGVDEENIQTRLLAVKQADLRFNGDSSDRVSLMQTSTQGDALATDMAAENISPLENLQSTDQASASEAEQKLLQVDINMVIDQWRRAWAAGDIKRYLAFYSDRFIPANGLDYATWESQRIERVAPDRNINVTLSNIAVTFQSRNAVARATFDQTYQAKSFSERSRKELVLNSKGDQWYIVSEREI